MAALAVGQAKSEEQLTAYGGEQSEVQRLETELETQRQEHEKEVAALQGKLAKAQETASRLVAAEAQLQDAQVASKEALAKVAKMESELAAAKKKAAHAKAQAAHDTELGKEAEAAAAKRGAAEKAAPNQAAMEQLQHAESELHVLRQSMHKQAGELEPVQQVLNAVLGGRWRIALIGSDCWEDADHQWVKCACLKLGDVLEQLKQQQC